MRIYGLQKLTLLDFPGRTACTVFTGGCNFRCPFCHNASLVKADSKTEYLSEGDFFAFLGKRRGLLDGVAITGGEPTVSDDLDIFIKEIKMLGFEVKLDTNGMRPDVVESLICAGNLDYVAMDVKNSPEKYPVTVGRKNVDLSKIEKTVSLLRENGIPHEFRTTVVKELHQAEDFIKIGEWLGGPENYYLQYFADSGDILSSGMSACSGDDMELFAGELKKYFADTFIRG